MSRYHETRIVTTSWDDGSTHDHRVAELLAAHKLNGTFYLPVKDPLTSRRIGTADMAFLDGQRFEIGAHGVSHPNMCACDPKQLAAEVAATKSRLENDLGKEISMFAYPHGKHNPLVIDTLKHAGFHGARTSAMLAHDLAFDPFRMPTSVRVSPHSRIDYLANRPNVWNVPNFWRYVKQFGRAATWIELAKYLFDMVFREGGVWHLFGRSWEVEELRLWAGLDEVLGYVSRRPGVLYLANGSVVSLREAKFAGAEFSAEPSTE